MKIVTFILAALLVAAAAVAQTAKTRDALYTEIDTRFADNTTGAITEEDLRIVAKNLAASSANVLSDAVLTSGSYANPAWLTSIAWGKITGVPSILSLLGISNGAALDTIGANGSAYYLSRTNHTGEQAIASITGLQAALDAKLGATAQAADVDPSGTAIASALAGKAAASHTHLATAISDSTATGRAVLTAADAAAARTAIGAGTSSFTGAYADLSGKPTLGDAAAKNTGSGAGEVAAGNHTHAGVYEPILGTPASDGYVLTSTAAGVRSWTAPGSGGGAAEKWDVVFDGQGAVVSSNVTVYRPVTVTGTIAAGVLIADVSGNATVSITRHTPSGGTLGSGTPLGNLTLSSAAHMRDTTLSGWTTAVTAGDVLAIKTESTTAARRLSVNLTQ